MLPRSAPSVSTFEATTTGPLDWASTGMREAHSKQAHKAMERTGSLTELPLRLMSGEVRPDDGYRAFWWSHHPAPDAARGHDY